MRRINAWLCNYATPVAAGVNGSARNDVAVPLINVRYHIFTLECRRNYVSVYKTESELGNSINS